MQVETATTHWAGSPPQPETLRELLGESPLGLVVHDEARLRDLQVMKGFLPPRAILAVELFAPLPDRLRPGEPPPFRLGSLHPEERRDALQQARRSLEAAERHQAPLVVVPPAPLDEPSPARVLRLLGRGAATPAAWEPVRRARAEAARRHLDSYLSTLSQLIDEADRYGRKLALTIAGPPGELPDLEELEKCLREFAGAPLVLWADTVRHSLYRATAGPGLERLEGERRGLVAGVKVHGGRAGRPHRPLGEGEVDLADWEWLRGEPQGWGPPALSMPGELPAGMRLWCLDLDAGCPVEDLRSSMAQLRLFLRGPEPPSFEPFFGG